MCRMVAERRAGDYPLARVDVNVEPLYSASVTRRGDSLPRRKSSEVGECRIAMRSRRRRRGSRGAVGGIREDRGWRRWFDKDRSIE